AVAAERHLLFGQAAHAGIPGGEPRQPVLLRDLRLPHRFPRHQRFAAVGRSDRAIGVERRPLGSLLFAPQERVEDQELAFSATDRINHLERFITDPFRRASSESAHNFTHQPRAQQRRAVMRKIVLSLAAAGAAIAIASPAAAQYYPQPQPAPYGYGNGFRGNWGEVRALHAPIDNVERQI